ncbi:MAG TPA: DUF262 domain-containing protein [Anaerolineales bacterium]|nr:DUF262 domain-containing protein [Anaerolineales bacterium]
MDAKSLKLSKVFASGGDVHYVLPHFQREYAWEKENWQTLLNDVMGLYEAYTSTKEPEHFMGALVVIQDGMRNGVIPAFKLVDGQQRLTTFSLILSAFGKNIETSHPAIYKRIGRLLTNPDESDLLFFKLIPTTKYGDRDAYVALLKNEEFPKGIDSKIPEAYQFFYKEIGNRIKAETIDPERLFIVLVNSLQVVFIDLDQGERPYEIFESLNAKGKPLSQADLVRNYIAMKLPEKRQAEIFNKYWSKIETILQEKRNVGKSSIGELTAFLRHYLTMRNGVLCNQAHVYERFRDRIENETSPTDEFEREIATLKNFAEHYNRLLRPENEPDKEIKARLMRLNILEVSTAYPFLMAVYESYSQKNLSDKEFVEVLEILENYIVRRYLTNDPTNYLNKMFPTLWREISPTKLAETLKKVIITKNYPADSRVRREVLTEQVYDKRIQTSNKIVLVLDTINRFLSVKSGGYTVLDNTPTIEHILPQTPSSEWKAHLGTNWEEIYTENLHTLGNLTLVTQEWNSKLSNSSFENKKNILASHALTLNKEYFKQKIVKWDEKAIQDRANFLVDTILEYWSELGTPPIAQKSTGTKPKSLTIMGQSFVVASWRDVAFYTAQVISELVDDFDTRIAAQLQSYFDKQEYKSACRQLPNGWWLYMNLSAVSVKSLCRNMILLAEISEEDWQVEEE